jgi:hypothetical protein
MFLVEYMAAPPTIGLAEAIAASASDKPPVTENAIRELNMIFLLMCSFDPLLQEIRDGCGCGCSSGCHASGARPDSYFAATATQIRQRNRRPAKRTDRKCF